MYTTIHVHAGQALHGQIVFDSTSTISSPTSSSLSSKLNVSDILPTALEGIMKKGNSSNIAGSVHRDPGSSQMEQNGFNKRARVQYYDLNNCLECELKEAEINTLKRRIVLLNQMLLQQSSGMLFSQMVQPPVVSQVVS